jgi:RNA polymerase sigma factor (sigma-70 family)
MTGSHADRRVEDLLRELAPSALATLARRHQRFDLCEDATQEALVAAATQWPVDGIPSNPKGWLVTVASRRWVEMWRSDTARRRREDAVAAAEPADAPAPAGRDDSLTLLFLCCHPALTPVSQIALTLRAVGGLTTSEIARALLVPESTVAQRISRAKARIRQSGARFAPPDDAERPARLAAVLHVLYLVFNEGYTASSGRRLHRVELSAEAIRLTRQLHAELPDEGEVVGLLALMLLTDARRPARATAAGGLVPLTEQDRGLWDRTMIAEGSALLTATLPTSTMGPYQVQAAIAAVHDEAATAADTDWPQILGLYDILATMVPGPMVTLPRIVALAMVRGPEVGLRALQVAEPALEAHHRIAAVRGHLLDLAGRGDEAREQYAVAARATLNLAERRYLEARAASASAHPRPPWSPGT